MITSIIAICLGACGGALLRWLISLVLNPLIPTLPLGTLIANWLGCWIMGIALSLFAFSPYLNQQFKLLLITGFLGSLTTFSSFAAEMSILINQGKLAICACAICLHVFGSIFMVFVGMGTFNIVRKIF